MVKVKRILCKALSIPIRIYQYLISPMLLPSCRFYPSCSHYALEAISERGIGKGLCLTIRRLLRCHPWATGGYDPVLPIEENK